MMQCFTFPTNFGMLTCFVVNKLSTFQWRDVGELKFRLLENTFEFADTLKF